MGYKNLQELKDAVGRLHRILADYPRDDGSGFRMGVGMVWKEIADAFYPDHGHVVLFGCGICDMLHPWGFKGDCRDDANRYVSVEDYIERNKDTLFVVRSMCERLIADGDKDVHRDPKDVVDGRCRFCDEEVKL